MTVLKTPAPLSYRPKAVTPVLGFTASVSTTPLSLRSVYDQLLTFGTAVTVSILAPLIGSVAMRQTPNRPELSQQRTSPCALIPFARSRLQPRLAAVTPLES